MLPSNVADPRNIPAASFPPPWSAEVTPNCFIVYRLQKANFLPPLGY
jgi:hypothetical protein